MKTPPSIPSRFFTISGWGLLLSFLATVVVTNIPAWYTPICTQPVLAQCQDHSMDVCTPSTSTFAVSSICHPLQNISGTEPCVCAGAKNTTCLNQQNTNAYLVSMCQRPRAVSARTFYAVTISTLILGILFKLFVDAARKILYEFLCRESMNGFGREMAYTEADTNRLLLGVIIVMGWLLVALSIAGTILSSRFLFSKANPALLCTTLCIWRSRPALEMMVGIYLVTFHVMVTLAAFLLTVLATRSICASQDLGAIVCLYKCIAVTETQLAQRFLTVSDQDLGYTRYRTNARGVLKPSFFQGYPRTRTCHAYVDGNFCLFIAYPGSSRIMACFPVENHITMPSFTMTWEELLLAFGVTHDQLYNQFVSEEGSRSEGSSSDSSSTSIDQLYQNVEFISWSP